MKYTFYALLLLLLSACAKQYKQPEKTMTRIEFGSGGGFTGAVSTFTLLENGQVFQQVTKNSEYLKFGKIKTKASKTLFEKTKTLAAKHIALQETGNITYFVRCYEGEKNTLDISFGNPSKASAEAETLYKSLAEAVAKK
jgi:hypothetical protein